MTSKKEVNQLMRRAERQGFDVRLSSGGHWHVKSPDGISQMYYAQTPSDYRAIKNIESDLRNMGMDAPTEEKVSSNGGSTKKKKIDSNICRWRDCDAELESNDVRKAHESIFHYMEGRYLTQKEMALYTLGAFKRPMSRDEIASFLDMQVSHIAPALSKLVKNGEAEREDVGVYVIAGLPDKEESFEDEEEEVVDASEVEQKEEEVLEDKSDIEVVEDQQDKEEEKRSEFGVGTVAEVVANGQRIVFLDEYGNYWLAEAL